MEKLISVIVPVYNVEKYIKQCVDSITGQTYKNLEIILVNDGSKDNSGKVCDELASQDSRIKVIHKENGGVSSARNAGLDVAKGEYIAFVDGDDYIDSTMYEKLSSKINEDNDIVFCGFSSFFPDGTTRECFPRGFEGFEQRAWDIKHLIPWTKSIYDINGSQISLWPVMVWASLYKKDIILENSVRFPLSIKMGEDRLFNMMYMNRCKQLRYIDEPLYFYRKGVETSATLNSNRTYCDLEHEIRRLELKIQLINENSYYSNEEKAFLILQIQYEMVYNYILCNARAKQLQKNKEYFLSNAKVKEILITINNKDLKRAKYSFKNRVLMQLIKRRKLGLIAMLAR